MSFGFPIKNVSLAENPKPSLSEPQTSALLARLILAGFRPTGNIIYFRFFLHYEVIPLDWITIDFGNE